MPFSIKKECKYATYRSQVAKASTGTIHTLARKDIFGTISPRNRTILEQELRRRERDAGM